MRTRLTLWVLLVLCGCERQVAVPTAQELIADRQLLTVWQEKCNTGEYSRLVPAQKSNLCSTTQQATISVSEVNAGKKADDFFDANTKRQ